MIFVILWTTLALLSAGTVLAGRPWTSVLARRRYPPELRTDPLFVGTNRIITIGWTVFFAVAAAASAVGPGWIGIVFSVLSGVLSPLSFRFGDWYSTRRLASASAVTDTSAVDGIRDVGGSPA
jgi:hypothetical protein